MRLQTIRYYMIVMVSILLCACGKKTKSTSASAGAQVNPNDPQGDASIDPEGDDFTSEDEVALLPVPVTGMNLTFQVEENIDKSSVTGYVVGRQDLKVVSGVDVQGQTIFGIVGMPEGKHDVLISAQSIDGSNQHGIRLNDVAILKDQTTDLGVLRLPEIGNITGKVTLAGKDDHSGIHVYIPGTGFDATTDTDGYYLISPFVLEGINNLYFEKDGYSRGQIEGINVIGGQVTAVSDMNLILSSGANGSIVMNLGEESTNSRTVNVNIEASENAVMMMLSENANFVGASWQPIKTSFEYEFTSDDASKFNSGNDNSLYVRFTDENGLESATFSDSIEVNLFPEQGSITINQGELTTDNRTLSLSVLHPKNGKKMLISAYEDFRGADWQDINAASQYTATKTGNNTIYLKFKDSDGYESQVYTDTIELDFSGNYEDYLIINNKASSTNTLNVSLQINPPAGASEMVIYNQSGVYSDDDWVSVADSYDYEITKLDQSDGDSATVYVRFKFPDGLLSDEASDGIHIDLFSDVSLSCGSGVLYDSKSLPLSLSYSSSVYQVKVSLDAEFSDDSWEAPAATKNATYESEGMKTAYVKFSAKNELKTKTLSCSRHILLATSHIYSNGVAFAALRSDGSVITWGDATKGGDSSTVSQYLTSGVTKIQNTKWAFAALKSDGSVVAWGDSTVGGTAVAGLDEDVVDIFSNTHAFAALKSDGSVIKWGDSGNGGISSAIAGLESGVEKIFSTATAFAAVKSDGSVVTWGHPGKGGDSSSVASWNPGVDEITNTMKAFAALKSDGTVVTWGNATEGGDSSSVTLTSVEKVFSAGLAFAALKTDGSVVSWGDASKGGDSSGVTGLDSNVDKIFSTGHAFAALKTDGSVITWGSTSAGGDSTGISLTNVSNVVSTRDAFAALKTDGSAVTWGSALAGGGNSETGVDKIFASELAFAALKSDGSVVAWGDSGSGGTIGSEAAALLTSGVSKIFSATDAFAALKSDGTIITWGDSTNGGDSSSVEDLLRPSL